MPDTIVDAGPRATTGCDGFRDARSSVIEVYQQGDQAVIEVRAERSSLITWRISRTRRLCA